MNGAKDTNNRTKKNKGSITVETAIVLPVFILVVFFIAYFIRIFYIYNTMQSSLIEATRKIGNMSYFYHLSGLKDYSEEINEASKEAQDKYQHNLILLKMRLPHLMKQCRDI